MTERLTAAKAAEIADKHDPAKAVDAILADVQKQAQTGRRTLRVNGYGFASGECYVQRDKWPEHCRRIQDELLALGFKAEVRVEERQFVDIWLQVSW